MCEYDYLPEDIYLQGLMFIGRLSSKRGFGFLKFLLDLYCQAHNAVEISSGEAISIIDREDEIYVGICACERILEKRPIRKCMILGRGIRKHVKNHMSDARRIEKDVAKRMLVTFSKLNYKHLLASYAGKNYAICNCREEGCIPLILERQCGIRIVRSSLG